MKTENDDFDYEYDLPLEDAWNSIKGKIKVNWDELYNKVLDDVLCFMRMTEDDGDDCYEEAISATSDIIKECKKKFKDKI